jgi:hypothetical protein
VILTECRTKRSTVYYRTIGIFAIIAVLFVAGCGSSGPAVLTVTTVSSALPAGSVSVGGGAYPSTTLSASGGTAPYTWAVTTGSTLPPGLSLGASGTISGSPTTAGTYNFSVTVTDAATPTAQKATGSLTITINPVLAVSTTGTLPTIGEAGAAYSATLAQIGGVGPFTWTLAGSSTLPTGLTLGSTGTISGTIAGSVAANTYPFTAKVSDSQGNSVSGAISIKVDAALTITAPSFSTGVVGVAYASSAFTASGGSGSGYTFAVASGTIAPLLLGANNGIVSGTPTATGTLSFTVKVTDSLGYTATTGNLSFTINPAIAVTLAPPSPVTLDGGKTQLVTATVSNDPSTAGVTWSAVTGLGTLTGSTTGSITYNAPAIVAAASTATFKATSVTDPTKSATYTVNLVPPPMITTTTMAAGNVNGNYSSPVTLSGGVAPYTWLIQAAPTGLVLNASTTSMVTVQGVPTVSGLNQAFTIKVTDAQGLSNTSSGLTISVYATLVLTQPSSALPTGVQGLNYPTTVTFTASGGSGTGYTWSVVAGNPLPTGLALSSASGASTSITAGPPTAAGMYPFAVKLMDSVGNTTTTSGLSITINPPIAVNLSPAQPFSMDQGTTQLITATVSNDQASAGVTWSTLTGLGSLTGSTSTTLTYNAPATIASSSIATFTATSVTDPTKSASFSVSLQPPPVIVTPTFPDGTLNAVYSPYTVTVNGGVGPYTWVGTTLPPGLTLSSSTTSTVKLQGTPTSAGASQTVTIKVTDAKGLTNTVNSTINIVAASCSTNCTISGTVSFPGTVSGLPISGVGITLAGPSNATINTSSTGGYTVMGLAGGTYTVTPSPLIGYTFSGSPATVVTSGSITTQNFTEIPVVTTYSISGLVSYSGALFGSHNTIIRVFNSGCPNCGGSIAGTSISSLPSPSGTAYTVRGLPPGSYIVNAEIDAQGTGARNSSNPVGNSATATINTTPGNLTGVNVTVSDRTPPFPTAPSAPNVFPASGAALVVYNGVNDSNGEELATSYTLSYGTNTNADNIGLVYHPGGDTQNVFVLPGLTNGAILYFKLAAFNGTGTSPYSSVFGPITINTSSGAGNTVSGTVTFTGINPSGRLNVGLYSGGNGVYFVSYLNPTSGQAFSISGVPDGKYSLFAFLDQKGCNSICAGNVTNFVGPNGPPQINVSGGTSTGNAIALTAFNSNVYVTTYHSSGNGNPDRYGVTLGINNGAELPISMTLYSAPNVGVPYDMNADAQNNVNPVLGNSFIPVANDPYEFQVAYANGSTQIIPTTVTGVSSTYATSLNEVTTGVVGGVTLSRNVPEFTWAAPSSPPAFYTYEVEVYDNNQQIWFYKGNHDGNGLPYTVTSAVFNSDGKASQASLTTGTKYAYSVTVTDGNGNSASYVVSYTP